MFEDLIPEFNTPLYSNTDSSISGQKMEAILVSHSAGFLPIGLQQVDAHGNVTPPGEEISFHKEYFGENIRRVIKTLSNK